MFKFFDNIGRFALAIVAGIFAALLVYWQAFAPINTIIYDNLMRAFPAEARQDIIIVGVDQYSIDNIGAWPWPRNVLAQVIENIQASNPKSVGVDLILDQSRDLATDATLSQTIKSYDNIVLPVIAEQYQSNSQLVEILPNANFIDDNARIGHVVRELDEDGVLRFVYLKAGLASPHWSSMALKMAEHARPLDNVIQNTLTNEFISKNPLSWHQNNMAYLPFTDPLDSFAHVSIYDVLRNYDYDFHDKFVLIGTTALGLGDTLITPVSSRDRPISGVEVVANELQAILDDNLINPVNRLSQSVMAFIFISLITLLYTTFNPKAAVLLGLFVLVSLFFAHGVALLSFQIYWPIAELLIMLILSYMLSSWQRLSYIVKITNRELLKLTSSEQGSDLNQYTVLHSSYDDGLRFLKYLTEKSRSINDTVESESILEASVKQSNRKIKVILQDETLSREIKQDLITRVINDNPFYHQLGQDYVLNILFANQNKENEPPKYRASYDAFIQQFELLHEFHNQAHTLKDFIKEAFNEIESGIIVANAQGQALVINASLKAIMGLSDEDDFDYLESVLDVLPPPKNKSWQVILCAVMKAQTHEPFESIINNIPVVVHVASYVDKSKQQSYFILNITDISMVKKSQAQREMFSSFLAHDLRSPLTSILAACELIKLEATEECVDSPLMSRINAIKKNAHKTLGYTNQLLNLGYAESLTHAKMKHYRLVDIMDSVQASTEPFAKSKTIALSLQLKVDEDKDILCNKDMLERSLINIINNAIKYSGSDTVITILVEVINNDVVFKIEDQGIGIDADEIKHVFDMYKRTEKKVDAERGMGLGLTFVKTVIEKHKGSISIDSKVGVGTTIIVKLPINLA